MRPMLLTGCGFHHTLFLNWPADQKWVTVQSTPLDQQFEDRLSLIESGDAGLTTVPDLPLRDFLLAVAALIVAVIALTWWAY